MTLRAGKQAGTIVADRDPSEDPRPYLDAHYGGRLIAEGVSEEDALTLVTYANACRDIPVEKLIGKTIEDYVKEEAYLTGMSCTGGVNIGLKGLAIQMLTEHFVGQFEGNGAVNYLEVGMTHNRIGDFVVTMQRRQGKTPAQLQKQAEIERDAIREVLASLLLVNDYDERKKIIDNALGVN